MAVKHVLVVFVCLHLQQFTTEAVQEIWEECSLSCGGGFQRKKGMKNETRMCNLINCPGDAGCLTVHYSFDTLMDGRAYDTSNNGNHGIIQGEAKLDNNGKFARCLHLPQHSNISLGAKTFHNRPSSAITIALWVKLASTSGKHELFHTCTSNVANGKGQFHFEINDGKVRWFHRDHMERTVFNIISGNTMCGVVNPPVSSISIVSILFQLESSIATDTWAHMAATYRTSTRMAKIYINGENDKLSTNSQLTKFGSSAQVNSLSPDWGCANIGDYRNERPLDGYVDDFFILKCELMAVEITALYQSGSFKRHKIPVP